MRHRLVIAVTAVVFCAACSPPSSDSSSEAMKADGTTTTTTGTGSGGAGAAGGATTTSTSGSGGGDSYATCDTSLDGHLDAIGTPGLSVGIIAGGELSCVAVAGMANIEENRAVTPDTLFAWASVSKTVTATALMVLYDEGHFDLDDDVDDYLPFAVDNPHCPSVPITFRQLLTHTSSIIDADAYYDLYTIGDSNHDLGGYLADYLVAGGAHYTADNYDVDCPGTYNEYSNVAVGLIGHLVEAIAGVEFDQFCRERIFEPLGMGPTSFYLAGLDQSGIAMPYELDHSPHGHVGLPTVPDGGLRTSVPSLARFANMMVGGGELDGQRVLSEATAALVLEVQPSALDDTQGLIWYYDYDGLVGHDGSDPGTAALMFYDPADGSGALITANVDWFEASATETAADALFAELLAEAKSR